MKTTKKFIKRSGKGVARAGGTLISAIIFILTPSEIGAEPINYTLPPSFQFSEQISFEWTFESNIDDVVCETEEKIEIEEFHDSRTFWRKFLIPLKNFLKNC